jgi:hypothetical protein
MPQHEPIRNGLVPCISLWVFSLVELIAAIVYMSSSETFANRCVSISYNSPYTLRLFGLYGLGPAVTFTGEGSVCIKGVGTSLGEVLPYAIVVGVISLLISSSYLISFCGGSMISLFSECCGINLFPILSFISLVWWIAATCTLTFYAPFLGVSNGWLGCWGALASSVFWVKEEGGLGWVTELISQWRQVRLNVSVSFDAVPREEEPHANREPPTVTYQVPAVGSGGYAVGVPIRRGAHDPSLEVFEPI